MSPASIRCHIAVVASVFSQGTSFGLMVGAAGASSFFFFFFLPPSELPAAEELLPFFLLDFFGAIARASVGALRSARGAVSWDTVHVSRRLASPRGRAEDAGRPLGGRGL